MQKLIKILMLQVYSRPYVYSFWTRLVNPIPIRGADYTHSITICPSRFFFYSCEPSESHQSSSKPLMYSTEYTLSKLMYFFTHTDIFRTNTFCMDISFPMDIFLYGHYSIWTFYLMDNLQIHRTKRLSAIMTSVD